MSTASNVFSATLAVGALALSVIAAGSALAQTPAATQSTVKVSVSDNQSGGRADPAVLAQRIADAARQACGNVAVHSPLDPRAVKACEREAIDRAMNDLPRGTQMASAE